MTDTIATTPKNIRKSSFAAQSIVAESAYFDFVANNQNFRISKANFLSAIGATGTIVQSGEATSLAILDKDGTINKIRNLLGGPGIALEISPENALKISHNFSVGDGGSPILISVDEDSPIIRNLVPGDGVSIAASGNNLVISVSGVPAASNVVIVNELSDFPTAAGGVITLGDDSAYLISAHLTTADRFVLGVNTVVYGPDSSVSSLTYTGVDAMFTAARDGSSKLTLLSLDCPNGALLDITSPTNAGVFQLVNATIISCDTIGTIGDIQAMQFTDVSFQEIISGGCVFTGDIGVFVGTRSLYAITVGAVFDFGTAVFHAGWSLESSFANLAAGTYFLNGLIDSGNMDAAALGTLFNTRFSGAGVPLNGLAVTDARWEFLGNDDLHNSRTSILATNSGTTVSILAVATPVIIGATWLLSNESRITGTAAGRFTYEGKGSQVHMQASITADIAISTQNCTFYVYKNGVEEVNSGMTRELSAGNPGNLSLIWQLELEAGDYIELFAENNGSTSDINVYNAIFGVNG